MTFRKEIIGDCELYHGDCIEVLPRIGTVSHVICDPPYEKEAHAKGRRLLGKQTNGQRTVKLGALNFAQITGELRDFLAKWGTENSKGWCLYFCQVEAVETWRDTIEKFNGKYKRACIWVKPDSLPQLNGQMPAQGFETFVCQWAGKGHSKWNGGGRRGVFTHPQREDNNPKQHQTQKPINLMAELIALFTNKDDLVCDPCMGSGTTGVACIRTERRFIGIESDQKNFEIALRRIEKAYNSPIFSGLPIKLKQEKFAL